MNHPIVPQLIQPGDNIVINNNPVIVTSIEKDAHGFDTYVRNDYGVPQHVFIPEETIVTLIQ